MYARMYGNRHQDQDQDQDTRPRPERHRNTTAGTDTTGKERDTGKT